MLNIIVDYLRQKANALTYIADSYGLAEIIDRRDGEDNVSFPAIYTRGELTQISFDTHPSLVFFTLDGEIERETDDGEISCEDQIKEVYKLRLYFFNAGKEISDCASITQASAYAIAKWLTDDNSQIQIALNLQELYVTATSFNFNKKEVWEELHNGIPLKLSERQQLVRIVFDVSISGVESCFVSDPCDLPSYSWTFDTTCCYTTKSIEVDITEGLQSVNHYMGGAPDLIQYWQNNTLIAGGFDTNVNGSQVLINSPEAYSGVTIKLIKFTGTCSTQSRLVRDIAAGSNVFNHNLSSAPDIIQFWIGGYWINGGFSTTITDTQITIDSPDDYDNVSIRLMTFNNSCGENQSIEVDLEAGEDVIPHELSGVPDFIQFQQGASLLVGGFDTEVDGTNITITAPEEANGIIIKAIKF